ncbi:C6 zinc finger domain protein [Aspergillus cavernicola]|uniref:C6 zinc finger domain protein n=1 Tax=Aspergillus cavernicola TaxID=176166 RepID=A0ABR4HM80_9EURO
MPVQRRLRRSLLECAQCSDGQMECSKARPQCDGCKSQRLSCRYGDQLPLKQPRRQSDSRSRKTISRASKISFTSDSSLYSSPSPPDTHRDASITSPASSLSTEHNFPTVSLVERAKVQPAHDAEPLSSEDQPVVYHWCHSTEDSLTPTKSKDRSWQALIRRESSRYLSLHHSTLALSALQLAFTNEVDSSKRKGHLQVAHQHYTQAVQTFPTIPNTPTPSACNAAFSTASILFMCELASSALAGEDSPFAKRSNHQSPTSPSLHKLLELFNNVRALSSTQDMLDTVEEGELHDLFTRSDPYHQLPSTYTLTILSMRNLNVTTAKKDASHESAVYDDAIAKLDKSLEMLSKGGDPTMIALRWMFRIPSRFLELVQEKQPLALIIFAHYCAVLHHLRDRWWMGDWGARLVKEISLLLGPDRIFSILWAADIVGVQT